MASAQKAKRCVMYVRVKPEEHALITQIAKKRGYPHTIASVAAKIIARGLSAEARAAQVKAPRAV
jgi:hypothetical protein